MDKLINNKSELEKHTGKKKSMNQLNISCKAENKSFYKVVKSS